MRSLVCAATMAMGCGNPAPAPAAPEAEPIIGNEPSIADAAAIGPPVAVLVIVDRSGSMTGLKLEAARAGAQLVADSLPDDALFGLIAFDSQPTQLVPLQAAAGRDRIAAGIARLEAGGGTDFLPPLRLASLLMSQTDAPRKRVVFVSDGEAAYDGVVEEVDLMAEAGVQTSTVGLTGADFALLRAMAEAGGGAVYQIDDPNELGVTLRRAIE